MLFADVGTKEGNREQQLILFYGLLSAQIEGLLNLRFRYV